MFIGRKERLDDLASLWRKRRSSMAALPRWDTGLGVQFENLVGNNAMEVASLMGLGRAMVELAAPYRNTRSRGRGARLICWCKRRGRRTWRRLPGI